MRPTGEIRSAIAKALGDFAQGATWKDVACSSGVGFAAARYTLNNMVRDAQVRVVGCAPGRGSNRPMVLYALPTPDDSRPEQALDAILRAWSRD